MRPPCFKKRIGKDDSEVTVRRVDCHILLEQRKKKWRQTLAHPWDSQHQRLRRTPCPYPKRRYVMKLVQKGDAEMQFGNDDII